MAPSSRASLSKCLYVPLLALAQAQDLPQGKGKDLVEQVCVGCHGLEVVIGLRATSKGWSSIVDNMIQRGATATPDDVRTIVDYLAKNFARPTPLNINKATAREIEVTLNLTGKQSEAIVTYRQDHGDFKDWDTLAKVPNLDLRKLEPRKDRIAFR